ncbi:MAG: basic amino acid ABC transporter substrate-binding protein [Candidatus Adiutrix sp.]|jgi:polar amino acid transport system substrate-binding protein|nr:basic amino acid ABC transporter substrate-binding protein [Candidatus Adiutrix sp.]
MKKFMLLAALAVALTLPATLPAQDGKTIKIAFDATWPPFEFVNENKEVTGFSVDYMKAAAIEGGYEVQVINAAWDGIFAGLVNKQYDAICSSVTITEERKKTMDFSTPYFTVRQAVITPKDSPVRVFDDLAGKTAGTQIGTTGTFAVDKVKSIISKTYDEVGLAVEDLYIGRIDAVVCDDAVASNFIMENKNYKEKLKIALVMDTPEAEELYGVAVRKGDSATLELINKGIEGVKAKGLDQELNKKWIVAE